MKEFINDSISKRFFEALNLVIASGAIRGVQTFCAEHNIDRRNMLKAQNDPTLKIQLTWIYYLCTDFRISADWIITGRGSKYREII